jgi:hypothetical protein
MAIVGVGAFARAARAGEGASSQAVAAYTPVPEVVRPFEAMELARRYVAAHPGTDYLVGSGRSMLPLYRDQTVIIARHASESELRAGMTAVFIGDDGRLVAHVLQRRTLDGWIAKGTHNDRADDTLVRPDNLVGVVVKAYQPATSPMVALLAEAGVRAALASVN